jgi:hypothetical protein
MRCQIWAGASQGRVYQGGTGIGRRGPMGVFREARDARGGRGNGGMGEWGMG